MSNAKRVDEDDDDQEEPGALSATALEERKKEIKAQLRVVLNTLRDAGAVTNGYDKAFFLEPPPPDFPPNAVHERFFRSHQVPLIDALWRKLKEQRFAFDPPDRFRVEWRVNDLGREKCQEIWELFDRDGDGVWDYSEFIEYRTALEERIGDRPEMLVFGDNEEVWRMYTTDVLETDASHGLTFEGFLRYREMIEDQYPLIHELEAFGIDVEPRAVLKARQIVKVLSEYLNPEEIVALKSVQFLLAECGTIASSQDVWQAVQRQRLFHRCHRFLLGQKRALRLFGYKQRSQLQLTNPALEEDLRVCRPALFALLLSAWTPMERTEWRRFFLKTRLVAYGFLRRVRRRVSIFFDWTRRAARTGLLRATCLQSTLERELGDYVFKVEVGPAFSTHSTVNMTYYSDADSAATLHELKYLERGAECFVYLDLLCRHGTRETDAQWLCQRLTWFVELYFMEHLELLPCFFKWFITIPTKMQLRATGGGGGSAGQNAPVIRLVVLFTGEMDLYAVIQSLNLPPSMQFDHFLQRLSMRWMFSHSIEEMVTNKRLVAGTQWSCRGQLEARFNRQAWGQIFRQCARQMDEERTQQREEQEHLMQQRRQQSDAQQSQQTPTKSKGNQDVPEVTCQGNTSSTWTEWLHRLAIVVDSSRELSMTWSFHDLRSLLEENAWIKTVLSSDKFKRLHHLITSAGSFASTWKSFGDSFRAEFATSRFVETAIATNSAAASAAATVGRGAFSRASSKTSELGGNPPLTASAGFGSSIAASFPFASPVSTPAFPGMDVTHGSLLSAAPLLEDTEGPKKYENEDPLEHDLLELYEASVKTLQSVQTLRAEAGTSGLSVAFEGWNIFSILPRVVPTSAVRKASIVRTKSTASNNSTLGSATAPSSVFTVSGSTTPVMSRSRRPSGANAL